jgi:hypothetical protein
MHTAITLCLDPFVQCFPFAQAREDLAKGLSAAILSHTGRQEYSALDMVNVQLVSLSLLAQKLQVLCLTTSAADLDVQHAHATTFAGSALHEVCKPGSCEVLQETVLHQLTLLGDPNVSLYEKMRDRLELRPH